MVWTKLQETRSIVFILFLRNKRNTIDEKNYEGLLKLILYPKCQVRSGEPILAVSPPAHALHYPCRYMEHTPESPSGGMMRPQCTLPASSANELTIQLHCAYLLMPCVYLKVVLFLCVDLEVWNPVAGWQDLFECWYTRTCYEKVLVKFLCKNSNFVLKHWETEACWQVSSSRFVDSSTEMLVTELGGGGHSDNTGWMKRH